MSGQPKNLVLCNVAKGRPNIPGSVVAKCCDCDVPCYMSPATLAVAAEHLAFAICPTCFVKRTAAEEAEFVSPSPDQIGEILAFGAGKGRN